MKRGEVYWADIAPRSGSEQSGRRPVIIVSNDGFNQTPNWNSLLVVPCTTSTSQARRVATIVHFPPGLLGLPGIGLAICHQVTTLDRSKLRNFLGILPAELLTQVDAGLKVAMDLP